ncbi:MAG: helicase HerA domain-containing protein [Candidatus Nanohalobium sp.]
MKKKIALIGLALLLTGTAAGMSVHSEIPALSTIFKQKQEIYTVRITNTKNFSQTYSLRPEKDLEKLVNVRRKISIGAGESKEVKIEINGKGLSDGLYAGNILVKSNTGEEKGIPVGFRVVRKKNSDLRLDVQTTSGSMRPKGSINVLTVLSSNEGKNVSGTITYGIRDATSGVRIYKTTRNVSITRFGSFTHEIDPLTEVSLGEYYIQARLDTGNRTVTATDTFRSTNPFWSATRIKIALFLAVGAIIIGGGFYTQRWYQQHKDEDARYVFPVDYEKLPDEGEDQYWVGKVAETEKDAFINPKDLTTHAIVAGSTGSGKSVTANVVTEEALENDVPVVVFDPTAQWTGFVKELKDDNVEEHYDRFDLNPEDDTKPYPGIIKEVTTGDPDIDFQQLKQPGEITVFTLNELTTEQFDDAVRSIIDQIFEIEWEESSTLEMLVIFDEVHRLLEKYGGEGGYEALERGAREFRKWGIGLMMCSQVTADFKQAISGNIMTEIQMQTKSMEDINSVEKKYGEEFAKRISSEDVGTGMIQNSNYNDGEPWFVDFRPTYHNPHKIPDSEMKKYHNLSEKLDSIRKELDRREEEGKDLRDKGLELQLAENKLKEGRFKMANMYIDSLKDEMDMS